MTECVDTKAIQAIDSKDIEGLSNLGIELESNPLELEEQLEDSSLTFPLSRVEAGKALGVSDVTVGKWLKKLKEYGANPLNPANQITEDGFNWLTEYSVATDKQAYLDDLKPFPNDYQYSLAKVSQENHQNPFGLTIATKASQRVEVLQGELENLESESENEFQDFLAITTEIVEENQSAEDQEDLEWQLMRKRNAQKWLKRKAILERDKQQILQSELPTPAKK